VARIYDSPHRGERRRLGSISAVVSLNYLEATLASLSSEKGRGTLTYVMAQASGLLIFASVAGVSGVWDPADPLFGYTQVPAIASNHTLIRRSAEFIDGSVPTINPLL